MGMEFDVTKFRAIYPQFANLTDEQLSFMAENALIISGLDVDDRIPAEKKYNLWYMLICHLATLAERGTAGALASATEGSVSASFQQMQHGRLLNLLILRQEKSSDSISILSIVKPEAAPLMSTASR